MDFNIRLQVLKDADMIGEATYEGVIRVIAMFEKEFNIKLTEENASMLITHLCIACERIRKGEFVEEIDDFIYDEIRKNAYFQEAEQTLKAMEKELYLEIPEREKPFIMMHLCTLYENTRG